MIEWYDFYIFGSLAAILSLKFYPAGNDTFAYIAYLATFAVGFLVRPFGALFFGRIGDLVGRKYAFLVTLSIMGGATALIGLLPTFSNGRLVFADHADFDSRAARTGAGRRIRRRGGLRCRTRAGQKARLLHQLHSDHSNAGTFCFADRDSADAVQHEQRQPSVRGAGEFRSWCRSCWFPISLYVRLKMKESPIFTQIKSAGMSSSAAAEGRVHEVGQPEARADFVCLARPPDKAWCGTPASSTRCSTCRRF